MNEHRPEVSAEVTGSPEEVWALIATGPGISTWFMPAQVDPREGGVVSQRHGPGDDDVSEGRITVYETPRRFVYEEDFEGRTVATEFLVEARSGGTCTVRVVTHGLGHGEAFEGLVEGWTQALGVLRVRAEHFRDQPAGSVRIWTSASGSLVDAWARLVRAVGLTGAVAGRAVERADASHPPFRGAVAQVQEHGVVVRVDGPHPGVLSFIATDFGDRTSVVLDRYVYAQDARAAVADEERVWASFLQAAVGS